MVAGGEKYNIVATGTDHEAVEVHVPQVYGKVDKDVEAGAEEAVVADMTEHQLGLPELEKALQTNFAKGLTSDEALMRFQRDGPNALTPPPKKHWFFKAMAHIVGGFAILLWAGSILCFIVYGIDASVENLTLGIVLAAVVLLTGTFSWYQEAKSDAVLDGFMKLAPSTCDVLRDGKFHNVDASEICIGDVVRLQFGKKIPADVIILESTGIKVDNSSLTGESEPLKRTPGGTDPSPWRSKNVAFFGTNCVEGTGMGVVARIGDRTAIGGIAEATIGGEKPAALMVAEIDRFVHMIGGIAITIGVIFLIAALILGYSPEDALIFTIGIIVANVPEGLLATVTVALTITAQRMASKNVLVKSTLIVETLGSVTAIASDKTGTLTQNRMTVRSVIYPDGTINTAVHTKRRSAVDVHEDKEITVSASYINYYRNLVKNAGLCNHATFDERESEILNRRTNGDASENALLKFCHSNGNADHLRLEFPEISCIPFNSHNKFMVTIHKNAGSDDYTMLMKGAPERVLEKCITYKDPDAGGDIKEFTEAVKEKVIASNTLLADNGERVLAFAQCILTGLPENFAFETDDLENLNFDITKMEFSGMISLEDPPREEVPEAIRCCHEAGIRVIMVTGDHPLTARSIASQIGILTEADGGKTAPIWNQKAAPEVRRNPNITGVVVTGSDLSSLDDDDWEYILTRNGIVFSRTLPAQKQDIVAKLQSRDEVVAVTGDGVNDSPALKKADVGIAMGSGSEIAKEAADLILIDDNFASIVKGIEEGRLIFSNLKKSIAYTLTSNIPEILPFLCQIVLAIPLGLTVIMILCVDLGTDILPAISFAYEFSESDIMRVPPRNRHVDKLVTWPLISFSYIQIGLIQAFAAFTTFFYVLNREGFTTDFILEERVAFEWIDEDSGKDTCFRCSEVAIGTNPFFPLERCADFDYRNLALRKAQTAFLATIVICQIGCGIACKTRMNSIVSQGFRNTVFNYGVFQEICLILALVYVPFLHAAFGTEPLEGPEWGIGVPFAIAILCYDESRKYLIRTFPDSLFKRMFYF
jgi:sodium/potassium-transporting ATPase subunit alpha